jgi:hypothetical protein
MSSNFAKYNLIDRNVQIKFFDKLGKIGLISALSIFVLTILITRSNILDNIAPKVLQLFYGVGTSVIIVFIIVAIKLQSKDFFISNEKICFLNDKIIIEAKNESTFPINSIKRLEFNYRGENLGPYHPIFNKRQQRGDKNFILIEFEGTIQNYEIFIPTNNELKRIKNFLIDYKMKGIELEMKNTTANSC